MLWAWRERHRGCLHATVLPMMIHVRMYHACDFSGFSPDFRIFFFTNLPLPTNFLERWEVHVATKGKKEVACIVSTPLHVVSCLWGCGESVNPPKLNIQEVQGCFVLPDQRETQACHPFFRDWLLLSNHTPVIHLCVTFLIVSWFLDLVYKDPKICKILLNKVFIGH